MYEMIDAWQQSDEYHYIDYIPFDTDNPKFLSLEDYFLETYLPIFSEKIIRIALKMMYYYPCDIFLTEPESPYVGQFILPFDTNVRNNEPEKIASAIEQIILKDFSSVQILFSEPSFLISICGEFSVTIYHASDEELKLLGQLCTQEGLFLKSKVKRNN